ncbi:MAG: hypothetical protein JRG71_08440 [Deltaproteobacteria bacterium]|nr:hypothetical protein [Deltaproteobacteria bacterium]
MMISSRESAAEESSAIEPVANPVITLMMAKLIAVDIAILAALTRTFESITYNLPSQ